MTTRPRALKRYCDGPPEYGLNIPAGEYADDGVRFLRTTDIGVQGGLAPGDGVFVPGDLALEPRHQLLPGDLLFSRAGSLGRCLRFEEQHGPATFAGYLVRFRPGSDADARFLEYCAQSKPFQAAIEADAITSTISNFNAERYASIKLPDVPLAEQRAIADYLDAETARIDALIAKKQQLIHLLEERLHAGVRSLVTGQAESGPRWEPGAPWVGSVPADWRPMKIAWHKHTGSGTTPRSDLADMYEGGTTLWVTTAELRESRIDSTAKCVTSKALRAYSALSVFPAETLLVAMYGATVGRLGVLGVPATTNQACCAIYGDGDLRQDFLYWWLRAFRSELMDLAYGAGQPNISQETIRSLRVPAPSEEQQRLLADRCADLAGGLGRTTRALAQQLDLLAEHRQALITESIAAESVSWRS